MGEQKRKFRGSPSEGSLCRASPCGTKSHEPVAGARHSWRRRTGAVMVGASFRSRRVVSSRLVVAKQLREDQKESLIDLEILSLKPSL